MANKIFSVFNPTKIVAVDTQVTELEFGVPHSISSPTASGGVNYDFRNPLVPAPSGESDERITVFIKILVGSFKLNVGADPSASPLTLTVGDAFSVTIHNRVSNLWFVASAAGDAFLISA